jgi:hypothetical protein
LLRTSGDGGAVSPVIPVREAIEKVAGTMPEQTQQTTRHRPSKGERDDVDVERKDDGRLDMSRRPAK